MRASGQHPCDAATKVEQEIQPTVHQNEMRWIVELGCRILTIAAQRPQLDPRSACLQVLQKVEGARAFVITVEEIGDFDVAQTDVTRRCTTSIGNTWQKAPAE